VPRDLEKLTSEELGHLFPIIISEPKTEWKELFIQEKKEIIALLGENMAIRVEHIGSTAVPNLAAKPTIDILVEIPEGEEVKEKIISIMLSNGYKHVPEPTHLMIVKGYTPDGFKGQSYHIHMGTKKSVDLWDRLYFRDYLIENPFTANEYAGLKKDLESRYRYDRDGYTEAKTVFIKRVTDIAKKRFSNRQ